MNAPKTTGLDTAINNALQEYASRQENERSDKLDDYTKRFKSEYIHLFVELRAGAKKLPIRRGLVMTSQASDYVWLKDEESGWPGLSAVLDEALGFVGAVDEGDTITDGRERAIEVSRILDEAADRIKEAADKFPDGDLSRWEKLLVLGNDFNRLGINLSERLCGGLAKFPFNLADENSDAANELWTASDGWGGLEAVLDDAQAAQAPEQTSDLWQDRDTSIELGDTSLLLDAAVAKIREIAAKIKPATADTNPPATDTSNDAGRA